MRDRGNTVVTKAYPVGAVITTLALTLLLSWPLVGAGDGGGGTRAAFSLAWRAEGKATFVVEPDQSIAEGGFVDGPTS